MRPDATWAKVERGVNTPRRGKRQGDVSRTVQLNAMRVAAVGVVGNFINPCRVSRVTPKYSVHCPASASDAICCVKEGLVATNRCAASNCAAGSCAASNCAAGKGALSGRSHRAAAGNCATGGLGATWDGRTASDRTAGDRTASGAGAAWVRRSRLVR